jgi:hypothetical protein
MFERRRPSLCPILDRPAPFIWRVLGVLGASAVFFANMGLLGGPVEGDASESVYSTWAIAHGDLACAYPTIAHNPSNLLAKLFALVAPVYPLISGAVAAVLRIGHSLPFPSRSHLGVHCQHTVSALFNWSVNSSAILTTIRISYITWPFLLLGAISVLRSSGRRGTWWEPFTALMLAFATPMWMCLVEYFHPQDVLAMSLILAAAATVLKRRWVWCGVVIGIAVATQQFALLPAVVLLVIAPKSDRWRYVLGAVISTLLIDLPLVVATSGRALRVILTGSSRAGAHVSSTGGTVLWELHMRGVILFGVARLLPIAAAAALGWWAVKRLGPVAREPRQLIAIIGTALALRLVFEENLFGYYFMAVAISLIMIDALDGRLRGTTWAWIGLVTLAWNPVNPGFYSNWTTWGNTLNTDLPIAILVIGLVAVLVDALHHRFAPYKYVFLLVAVLTNGSRVWGGHVNVVNMPHWGWQLLLVPSALVLCAGPLWQQARVEPQESVLVTV